MKTRTPVAITLIGALAVLLLIAPRMARAAPMSFQKLAQRLPPSSNAIVAINLSKVLDSPYAKREHWGSNAADAWAKQPVMIPPGASRLVMAASVKLSSMDSYWEMSLIQMDKMPSLKELANAEGGHIDRVWDREAAYSPINAYFVPIEPSVLASITPAERAEIARWVRQPLKPEGNVTSAYIRNVVAGLSEKTDIVMALDLDGAYGLADVRRFIDDHDIKEIPAARIDMTAAVLASMEGITLEVNVGENITCRTTVQFEKDVTLLAECAKPVMLAALKRCGMRTADAQEWKFVADGKQVTMQGNLSAATLRDLLGLVQTPVPAATLTTTTSKAGAAQTAASVTATPAEASQRYYKAINLWVRGLSEGTSMAATATTIRNTAKRIDQLPILNVDPALVQWGAMVSTKLKQAGGVLATGQVQINARVLGVRDPDYVEYSYDADGNAINSASANSDAANRERRQVSAEQKAQLLPQALAILGEINEATTKIRAEMVEKYKIEF